MLQLRSWAGERFPQATLVTEGLDLKAWNRIASVLDRLATDWSGVARELGWITTRHPLWEDDVQGAIAAAESIFGEKIAFNPFYFSRSKLVAETAAYGERTGWHPAGAGSAAEEYFVSHEWGHLVHAWLRRHDRDCLQRLTSLFAIDANEPRSPVDPSKVAAISLYAKRGISDAFADAFSVIQWRKEEQWPAILRQFSRILGGQR
jgi:hypothetical protein